MTWLILLSVSLILVTVIGTCDITACKYISLRNSVDVLLVRIAALDELFIYIVSAGICLAAIISLSRISNHAVLTLDILYNLSILFLVLYNIFKEPEALPIYSNVLVLG